MSKKTESKNTYDNWATVQIGPIRLASTQDSIAKLCKLANRMLKENKDIIQRQYIDDALERSIYG